MYQKFTQLSFVIGLFFTIVSVILFGNALINNTLAGINLYTAVVFIIFGVVMMLVKNDVADE